MINATFFHEILSSFKLGKNLNFQAQAPTLNNGIVNLRNQTFGRVQFIHKFLHFIIKRE